MTKNVLVTGGAGYIGSHACKQLSIHGYNPITVDNLSTGWRDSVKYGPLEVLDLLDSKGLNALFDRYQPSAIMHFAACSQVGESTEKPGFYWRNNVLGSLNLIEAAIAHNCLDFVFSSTCATYGDHDTVVLTEKTDQFPLNAYGASKKALEDILRHFMQITDLRYVIFRYFNVAGADHKGDIGEFHQPETHLVPLVLDAVSGNRGAITIFGTDYDTHDGTCIRDYVHVNDLIDAHLLGLERLKNNGESRVYNLGTGTGFSVREIINQVQQVTHQEVPQIEGRRRFGDCTKLVSDPMLAMSDLGWDPKRSNLERIITDAWRWHKTSGYEK